MNMACFKGRLLTPLKVRLKHNRDAMRGDIPAQSLLEVGWQHVKRSMAMESASGGAWILRINAPAIQKPRNEIWISGQRIGRLM